MLTAGFLHSDIIFKQNSFLSYISIIYFIYTAYRSFFNLSDTDQCSH